MKFKRILFSIFLGIVVLVVLNFGFFWGNLKFIINKPEGLQQVQNLPDKIEPNRLVIQSLNLDLPIVYANLISETQFQQDLQNGVVHYPKTANPGEVGNVYIFGHSSDYLWTKGNYKYAFSLLPQIKIGDSIVISNQAGDKFVYKVTETKVVAKDDLSVLNQNTDGQKLLTLQTSYSLGTAFKRYIVVAKLEQ